MSWKLFVPVLSDLAYLVLAGWIIEGLLILSIACLLTLKSYRVNTHVQQ